MISPEFSLSGVNSPILTFKAKSVNDDYGLERLEIGVGNTTNPNDFNIISDGFLVVPTEWTTYEFDLSDYVDQNIRIALHYVSDDSFVLQTMLLKLRVHWV